MAVASFHRVALILIAATWLTGVEPTLAQVWDSIGAAVGTPVPTQTGPHTAAPGVVPYGESNQRDARGPLARLVTNPDQSSGLPPFALTDQAGAIQRYVEPVPGIDLAPYVGQIVVVRHDTGRILLASQLDLPVGPLQPLFDGSRETTSPKVADRVASSIGMKARTDRPVRQAQHIDAIDEDDTTVELLDEGESLPNGNGPLIHDAAPEAMSHPHPGYPVFPGEMLPVVEGPGFGSPSCEPMPCGSTGTCCDPTADGMTPCPRCGRYHSRRAPNHSLLPGVSFNQQPQGPTRIYGDVQINFLRAHFMEDTIGKLSEKYAFSPRFVFGFRELGPLEGRVRYWLYDRKTQALQAGNDIRLDLDVLDIEGTHHFASRRSELVLAGGLRLAQIDITDSADAEAGTDLLGMTLAADGRTRLLAFDGGRFAWVYGGRLSLLAGDWGGEDGHLLIDHRVRDDNIVVHELHAGLEYTTCYRHLDLRARLAFEMQNWHSDVLADSAGTDSISFVGPGLHVGAEF